jgi:indole-3-glycerol phosphate synthase
MNILEKIVSVKKQEVADAKKHHSINDFDLKKQVRNFEHALRVKKPAIIAEIKKASPSKGIICEECNIEQIARSYQENGAACLSVLTDRQFFQGADEYLIQARNASTLPVLRKDFIIDSYQIYQAKNLNADCILLIKSILDDSQLYDYYQCATELGISALVECHTRDEVESALKIDASLIGINNRNLASFKTDINTSIELSKVIPKDKVVITESGINTSGDIKLMLDNAISTFLIGEAFMREADPGAKLKELISL